MSPAVQQIVLLFVFANAGAFLHYLKNWLSGVITGSLFHYLFVDSAKRTALAFFSLYGAIGTMVLTNQLAGMTWQQVVMLAVTTGFSCDSLLNKSTSQNDPQVAK